MGRIVLHTHGTARSHFRTSSTMPSVASAKLCRANDPITSYSITARTLRLRPPHHERENGGSHDCDRFLGRPRMGRPQFVHRERWAEAGSHKPAAINKDLAGLHKSDCSL